MIPLAESIAPYDALPALAPRDCPHVALLESQGETTKLGRYAFLCVDPFLVFRAQRDRCEVGPPGALEPVSGEPFAVLRTLLRRHRAGASSWSEELPPFIGGAAGYLGYEMLYLLAKIPDTGRDDRPIPDAYWCWFHTILATDRHTNRSWLIVHAFAETEADAKRIVVAKAAEAQARLASGAVDVRRRAADEEALRRRRAEIVAGRRLSLDLLKEMKIRPVIEREAYLDVVRRAREHIAAGDIFEVCTSQRFDTEYAGSGTDLLRVLRSVSEAPFASYLRYPELEVISSSPERFLSLDRERWAETRPIKGTRPRGATPEADAALHHDLATCEKDAAENVMIVDLARSDLGRVCEFGSVTVPELLAIESYPFTHQMVSTVRGRVRHDVEPIDVVMAAFPGGSVTGAPKHEAMKIIDSLEPVKRGVFSGAIGYFDLDGAFDLNIVIRTFVKRGDDLHFHVGGAVVPDSVPADEYQETLDKAHGLVTALELARAGGAR